MLVVSPVFASSYGKFQSGSGDGGAVPCRAAQRGVGASHGDERSHDAPCRAVPCRIRCDRTFIVQRFVDTLSLQPANCSRFPESIEQYYCMTDDIQMSISYKCESQGHSWEWRLAMHTVPHLIDRRKILCWSKALNSDNRPTAIRALPTINKCNIHLLMSKLYLIVSANTGVTHLVTHLVWPHGGPISMRPRALRTMQNP